MHSKQKKAEAARKKAADQRAKEIAKKKEEAKKKAEASKAAKDSEKKDEEEKKEEEVKEEEEAKVEDVDVGEPPVVELDDDEKQLNFMKKSVPDLTPEVLSRNYAKFSTPDGDEGFDDIRYEWLKGDKAVNYLKKWVMEKSKVTGAGQLREEGEVAKDEEGIEAQEGPDEVYDESGNKIDVKKNKPMEAKDIKKAIKDVEKKLKDHKKNSNLSEEEVWQLEDKLAELNAGLPRRAAV